MKLFHSATNPRAHHEFLAWVRANPTGFYLNERSPTEFMLHRGRCSHIEFNRPVDLANARKVAAPDRATLEAWARSEGVRMTESADCLRAHAPRARFLED